MTDTPTPPVLHPANIAGSPFVTVAAILAAVSQYLATNGAVAPHTTQEWVQFAIGVVIAGLGALARLPVKKGEP